MGIDKRRPADIIEEKFKQYPDREFTKKDFHNKGFSSSNINTAIKLLINRRIITVSHYNGQMRFYSYNNQRNKYGI